MRLLRSTKKCLMRKTIACGFTSVTLVFKERAGKLLHPSLEDLAKQRFGMPTPSAVDAELIPQKTLTQPEGPPRAVAPR